MDVTTEELGARIRELREARRWSQADLARMLDVSVRTVGNWEVGRNHPRSSMGALREIFGSAIDDPPSSSTGGGDPVLIALSQSELVDWRQDEVRAVYRRNLSEQRDGVRGA